MKNTLVLFLLLAATSSFSQTTARAKTPPLTKEQVHSLALLSEVWGFLKYYHPAVAQGQQNWDSVLIQKIPLYLGATGREAISSLTAAWLNETGTPPICNKCDNAVPDSLKFNLDLSWINENNFSKAVVDRLFFIRDNRNQGGNRFVALKSYSLQFTEKSYNAPVFKYPDAGYRLLLLFRYWNVVNYFSPYKYICGRDWKDILQEKIPVFYGAPDTLALQLEFVKLVGCLNDGHANFNITPVLQRFFGANHYPPFGCKYIDGQLVVSKFYNDSLARITRMKPGDVLTVINGEKISDKMARLIEYSVASNDAIRPHLFGTYFLFTGADSNFIVTKTRKGKKIIDSFAMPPYTGPSVDTSLPWRLLDGNIGYVNMGNLVVPQVDAMMQALAGTRGIVFDVRNYPQNTAAAIVNYLCSKPFIFCRTSIPDINYPGVFRFGTEHLSGRVNEHPYAGKLVILADESSASHAEYSIMCLQAAAKTMTIGSTTAGQDGNFSQRIYLPGALFTRFSSLGIYYPDGTIAQRKGVRIDKTVIPTIRGLQEGRDEVLEAGINYIKSN